MDERNNVINVKIDSKDELYSTYSFGNNELNPEFSDFLYEKVKYSELKSTLTINIHTGDKRITTGTISRAMQQRYHAICQESRKELRRLCTFAIIMFLLGGFALTGLVIINHYHNNFYITSVIEIAAWVFVWEAVDTFFLQCPGVSAKCLIWQRLRDAHVQVNYHTSLNEDSAKN